MKRTVAKYFWSLNEKALIQAEKALRKPDHPKFITSLVTFLSRCNEPKELFSLLSKKEFIANWPRVKSYWLKIERKSEFRDWWDTIYERLAARAEHKEIAVKGGPSRLLKYIGRLIKLARLKKGLSQNELALKTGMKQPDISKIEEGRENITLATLSILSKALGIKKIEVA